jgi:hypothetical protein
MALASGITLLAALGVMTSLRAQSALAAYKVRSILCQMHTLRHTLRELSLGADDAPAAARACDAVAAVRERWFVEPPSPAEVDRLVAEVLGGYDEAIAAWCGRARGGFAGAESVAVELMPARRVVCGEAVHARVGFGGLASYLPPQARSDRRTLSRLAARLPIAVTLPQPALGAIVTALGWSPRSGACGARDRLAYLAFLARLDGALTALAPWPHAHVETPRRALSVTVVSMARL